MNWEQQFRRLEEGVQIPIPLDDDGYLDRECRDEKCESEFKVLADDWRDKVRDEEVFCPICGHTAESDEWLTQEQEEHVRQVAEASFQTLPAAETVRLSRNVFQRLDASSQLWLDATGKRYEDTCAIATHCAGKPKASMMSGR